MQAAMNESTRRLGWEQAIVSLLERWHALLSILSIVPKLRFSLLIACCSLFSLDFLETFEEVKANEQVCIQLL